MRIRDMTIDDLPEVARLYRQFWNEPSSIDRMRAQFPLLQKQGTHLLLCAAEGDRLLGTVMGVVCAELYGDCRPFLVVENMVVDAGNRKRGVGTALLGELERRAEQKNCTQMILVTETDRTDACAFYESAGFHPTANRGYKKRLQAGFDNGGTP